MVKFINFESTCLNSQQYINLNVTDSNSLIYTFHDSSIDSKDDTQNLKHNFHDNSIDSKDDTQKCSHNFHDNSIDSNDDTQNLTQNFHDIVTYISSIRMCSNKGN